MSQLKISVLKSFRDVLRISKRQLSQDMNVVKVQLEQGWLQGERRALVTKDGDYCSFRGVPYAAPPLGPLRFKDPQPPKPWEGVRRATAHGPKCPQVDIFTKEYIRGSEDCLYLNVYTKDINQKTPLPVMVFIHGGGYKSGSGDEDHYGPDFLVNHGVVLVTINYRLDALGFLSIGSKDVPGNAGLKDQRAALKWVQKNIEKFGGDPSNVTVFGESAGGASTAFHVLSSSSKGLLHKAISMSGVPFCDWSQSFHPRKRAFTLAKILGYETSDEAKLLEFLQNVPVKKLVDANPCITSWEEQNNNLIKFYHFTPVVENDFGQDYFITKEPMEILKKGDVNDVDLMFGYTNEEVLVALPAVEELLRVYNRYHDILVPRKILMKSNPNTVLEISDKIRNHFFGDKPLNMNSIREACTYFNEACFVNDVTHFLRLLSKASANRKYMYQFSCVSERNVYSKTGAEYGMTGASHLEDLMYLFDAKLHNLPIDKDSKSYRMVQQTCALFTNFAKYGNPTPDSSLGVKWPEYDDKEEHYLDINENLTVGKSLNSDAIKFWSGIYKDAGIET